MSEKEPVVLCAASSYEQKYYLNEAFSGLPTAVKEELQVMCVLYTADVGGILTLQFDEDGNLQFQVCLLYTSPSPRERTRSRMPSSA